MVIKAKKEENKGYNPFDHLDTYQECEEAIDGHDNEYKIVTHLIENGKAEINAEEKHPILYSIFRIIVFIILLTTILGCIGMTYDVNIVRLCPYFISAVLGLALLKEIK